MYNLKLQSKTGVYMAKARRKTTIDERKRLSTIVLNTIAIIRKRRHFMMFL